MSISPCPLNTTVTAVMAHVYFLPVVIQLYPVATPRKALRPEGFCTQELPLKILS